ncbi:hypothetical protein NL676_024955 [Syzygium grande]|nr:hypothetical protein NL676_024955 [Syzygium grande]
MITLRKGRDALKDTKERRDCYSRSISPDGTRVMTLEEFKHWLKKFDAYADGRISKEELHDIIRITGGGSPGRRASRQ